MAMSFRERPVGGHESPVNVHQMGPLLHTIAHFSVFEQVIRSRSTCTPSQTIPVRSSRAKRVAQNQRSGKGKVKADEAEKLPQSNEAKVVFEDKVEQNKSKPSHKR